MGLLRIRCPGCTQEFLWFTGNRSLLCSECEKFYTVFAKAVREKKWLEGFLTNDVLSPKELKEKRKLGLDRMSWIHWRLVDPPKPIILDSNRDKALELNKELQRRIDEGWDI